MIIAPVQGGMQDQMRFEDDNGDWINFSTEHPSNADGKSIFFVATANSIPFFLGFAFFSIWLSLTLSH